MRLARWSVDSYSLPYEREVRWSDIVESAAQFVLLRLESDSGHAGVAEATVKPTWSGVSRRTLEASVEELFIPILQKGDVSDPVAVRQRLEAIPDNHAAKALVDNAVWDLYAAKSGKALWQLWGGRSSVDLSWAVTRQSPALMAKEAAEMVERYGFRTLKVKGGQGLGVDVQGMREIRTAVGEGVRLYVDANGFYSMQESKSYVKAMADAGAEVVEDPCPLCPDAQFEALQKASSLPILVDFGCASRRDAALFIERGARALSLKPGRFGLSDTRAMLDTANKAGCATVVGLFGESALGTLAALQLASILPAGALPSETTWYLAMTRQVLKRPLEIRGGAVELPPIAGLASLL
jgi:L-alanine-DL-glutamate epimerase-like enolase superfamily enzyme